jgi:crotonobetainyl-CoA:carnitine CoA-transferase CaiB-like acyl-CoA transferase
MFNDPHYKARGLFEEIDHVEGTLTVPAIHPKLSDTPGRTDSGGPDLGQHNEEILRDVLGMDADQIEALRAAQVI